MLLIYWMLVSVTFFISTKAEQWKCPEITQKPIIECSCDFPHTLRCNGNKQALKIINRLLKNSSISLLDCTLQGLKYLPAYLLRNVSLHGLVISSGEIINVHEFAFSDSLTPLQALGLPNNQLTMIPNQATRHLIDLERLDLSRNRIKKITKNDFKELYKLQYLDLSDNRLEDISSEIFEQMKNLKILRLRGNRLNVTNLWKIANAKNLQELDISSNVIIGPLTIDLLPKLGYLQELYINHNLMSSIRKGALRGCKNLTALSLSHNQIDVIEDDAFSNLGSLRKLDLAHNRIVTVSNSSLAHLEYLQELDLSYNFLRALTSDLVHPLTRIRSLMLDENDISIITEHVFDNNRFLEKLTLIDNPLNCDCGLIWFMDWLLNQTQLSNEDKSTIICTTPPHLENALLIELSKNYLHCSQDHNDYLPSTSTSAQSNSYTTTMQPTTSSRSVQINLRNFWFGANQIYIQWNILNFDQPYKCDSLFIYRELNNSEQLLETKPLKCHSDNFENPEILNIEFKRNSSWTLHKFYRFCLVLLLDSSQKQIINNNSNLIIGCSDLINLVVDQELVEINNDNSIDLQTNFTKLNKIFAKVNITLPATRKDNSICSLNLTLIEWKRNFLLDHRHHLFNNCTNFTNFQFQFDNNPNVLMYRLCVNFLEQKTLESNLVTVQEKCVILKLPELKIFDTISVTNLYLITFILIVLLSTCLIIVIKCQISNNTSQNLSQTQCSEDSCRAQNEEDDDKDDKDVVVQQINGYVKLDTA